MPSSGTILNQSQMSTNTNRRVSVVIPAYNERGTIEEILLRVQNVDLAKEIIIVDDASTDGTREFLSELARHAEHGSGEFLLPNLRTTLSVGNIRVFFLAKNGG
jgi:glycosyltransferase involved in cell wall biosynthesis